MPNRRLLLGQNKFDPDCINFGGRIPATEVNFASIALIFGCKNGAAALAASRRRAIGECGSRISRNRKSNGISPPASAASSNARVRLFSEPRGLPLGLPEAPGRKGRPRCFPDLFTASNMKKAYHPRPLRPDLPTRFPHTKCLAATGSEKPGGFGSRAPSDGDAANVILTAVGRNLRLVVAWPSSLLRFILLDPCRPSPSRPRSNGLLNME
jgi:hypothetical protein